jgi:hypothetical protein
MELNDYLGWSVEHRRSSRRGETERKKEVTVFVSL